MKTISHNSMMVALGLCSFPGLGFSRALVGPLASRLGASLGQGCTSVIETRTPQQESAFCFRPPAFPEDVFWPSGWRHSGQWWFFHPMPCAYFGGPLSLAMSLPFLTPHFNLRPEGPPTQLSLLCISPHRFAKEPPRMRGSSGTSPRGLPSPGYPIQKTVWKVGGASLAP